MNSGSLDIGSPGGLSDGVWDAAAGATVFFAISQFSTYTFAPGTKLEGTGLFDIDPNDYSALNNNITITVANLEFDSGTLGGTGTFSVTASFNWTGGDITSPLTINVASGATTLIDNASSVDLGGILNNSGAATWSGANINGQTGGAINNLAGGVFTDTGANSYDGWLEALRVTMKPMASLRSKSGFMAVSLTAAAFTIFVESESPTFAQGEKNGKPHHLGKIALKEVAAESGVSFRFDTGSRGRHDLPEIMGGGVALFDADGDGRLDIYLCNGGPIEPTPGKSDPPCRLYRNQGAWHFEDITDRAAAPGPSYAMGAAVGDYDGDGRLDLFVTGWRDQRLYRNLGGGRFADVTIGAGLSSGLWSTSSAFADLDGDGDLDLYVANYLDFDAKSPPYCTAPDGRSRVLRPRRVPRPTRPPLPQQRRWHLH